MRDETNKRNKMKYIGRESKSEEANNCSEKQERRAKQNKENPRRVEEKYPGHTEVPGTVVAPHLVAVVYPPLEVGHATGSTTKKTKKERKQNELVQAENPCRRPRMPHALSTRMSHIWYHADRDEQWKTVTSPFFY